MWCFDALFLTVKVCVMTAVNKYRETLDRSPQLLSVEMNQTPACMQGPASITTCQLCVVLFKNHQPVCTSTGILFIFTVH